MTRLLSWARRVLCAGARIVAAAGRRGARLRRPAHGPLRARDRLRRESAGVSGRDFSNGLTAAEGERLALLAEECGEVVQAIGKVLRHGFASSHPDGGPDNRDLLAREIGGLRVALELVMRADVSEPVVDRAELQKWINLPRYLHHPQPLFIRRRC